MKQSYDAVPLLTPLEQTSLTGVLKVYADRLQEWLKDYVSKLVYDLLTESKNLSQENQEYLTVDETCSFLKVSKSTLHRWSEKGRVNKMYLFGKPRYLKSELLSLFKSIEALNTRK